MTRGKGGFLFDFKHHGYDASTSQQLYFKVKCGTIRATVVGVISAWIIHFESIAQKYSKHSHFYDSANFASQLCFCSYVSNSRIALVFNN